MEKIYFVTSNEGKANEVQSMLEFPIEVAEIEIDEIQDLNIEKIVRKKVIDAYKLLKKPVIVDDAGLYINSWNGFPGAFVKYILVAGGSKLLLKMLRNEKDRRACFKAVIGFCDGKNVYVFSGKVNGKITSVVRGRGWGFDSVFIPDGKKKTYGEMSKDEKNAVSHRRRALDKFKKFLKANDFLNKKSV